MHDCCWEYSVQVYPVERSTGRHDSIMKRCAVHFLIPPVVNICHFEQGAEIRVRCGGDHPALMHEGGTNNPFMVAGGVGLRSKPCAAILIDITSLSVIVLELLYPHNKTARSFFSCFICETKLLSQHGSVSRYLPSRLLLMAFKVVTCKVLTFIMIVFEGRHGAKVCWYQEATSLWIIVLRPRWKIVLCGSVSPRDKSTSHISHLGLSKLLSVGLFAPPYALFTHFLLTLWWLEKASCRLFATIASFYHSSTRDLCSFLIISAGLSCYFSNLYPNGTFLLHRK